MGLPCRKRGVRLRRGFVPLYSTGAPSDTSQPTVTHVRSTNKEKTPTITATTTQKYEVMQTAYHLLSGIYTQTDSVGQQCKTIMVSRTRTHHGSAIAQSGFGRSTSVSKTQSNPAVTGMFGVCGNSGRTSTGVYIH